MSRALTRKESRAIDQTATAHYGIAGLILMENAGAAVAREALKILHGSNAEKIVVVCGKGNNGGDGFVAARHLISFRIPTSVCLLCLKEDLTLPSDAATNLDILERMVARGFAPDIIEVSTSEHLHELSAQLSSATVVIDAILGTGLTGAVREPASSAIDLINSSGASVISVDIPSGLDADEGVPLGKAVRADVTVTFVREKVGLSKVPAKEYLGKLIVAEIGCGFLLRE